MSRPFYKLHRQNDSLQITLDSSSDGNALTLEKAQALMTDLKKLRPSLVCVTNVGPSFCAGGNLRFYQGLKTREAGLEVNRQIQACLDEFQNFPAYKIARVDGLCVGGGIEFLGCFDQVIATSRSLFGLWQRRIGLTFGWGGENRLRKRMSEKALKGWLLRAETLSCYQAHHLGLVDQVVSWRQEAVNLVEFLNEHVSREPETLQSHLHSDDSQSLFEELWLGPAHQRALAKFTSVSHSVPDAKPSEEGE